MLVLTVLDSPEGGVPEGTQYRVPEGTRKILGRGSTAQVRVAYTNISRAHAELIPYAGAWYIKDLGSTNGTKLNGERLSEIVALRDGDRVRIAKHTFNVSLEENPREVDDVVLLVTPEGHEKPILAKPQPPHANDDLPPEVLRSAAAQAKGRKAPSGNKPVPPAPPIRSPAAKEEKPLPPAPKIVAPAAKSPVAPPAPAPQAAAKPGVEPTRAAPPPAPSSEPKPVPGLEAAPLPKRPSGPPARLGGAPASDAAPTTALTPQTPLAIPRSTDARKKEESAFGVHLEEFEAGLATPQQAGAPRFSGEEHEDLPGLASLDDQEQTGRRAPAQPGDDDPLPMLDYDQIEADSPIEHAPRPSPASPAASTTPAKTSLPASTMAEPQREPAPLDLLANDDDRPSLDSPHIGSPPPFNPRGSGEIDFADDAQTDEARLGNAPADDAPADDAQSAIAHLDEDRLDAANKVVAQAGVAPIGEPPTVDAPWGLARISEPEADDGESIGAVALADDADRGDAPIAVAYAGDMQLGLDDEPDAGRDSPAAPPPAPTAASFTESSPPLAWVPPTTPATVSSPTGAMHSLAEHASPAIRATWGETAGGDPGRGPVRAPSAPAGSVATAVTWAPSLSDESRRVAATALLEADDGASQVVVASSSLREQVIGVAPALVDAEPQLITVALSWTPPSEVEADAAVTVRSDALTPSEQSLVAWSATMLDAAPLPWAVPAAAVIKPLAWAPQPAKAVGRAVSSLAPVAPQRALPQAPTPAEPELAWAPRSGDSAPALRWDAGAAAAQAGSQAAPQPWSPAAVMGPALPWTAPGRKSAAVVGVDWAPQPWVAGEPVKWRPSAPIPRGIPWLPRMVIRLAVNPLDPSIQVDEPARLSLSAQADPSVLTDDPDLLDWAMASSRPAVVSDPHWRKRLPAETYRPIADPMELLDAAPRPSAASPARASRPSPAPSSREPAPPTLRPAEPPANAPGKPRVEPPAGTRAGPRAAPPGEPPEVEVVEVIPATPASRGEKPIGEEFYIDADAFPSDVFDDLSDANAPAAPHKHAEHRLAAPDDLTDVEFGQARDEFMKADESARRSRRERGSLAPASDPWNAKSPLSIGDSTIAASQPDDSFVNHLASAIDAGVVAQQPKPVRSRRTALIVVSLLALVFAALAVYLIVVEDRLGLMGRRPGGAAGANSIPLPSTGGTQTTPKPPEAPPTLSLPAQRERVEVLFSSLNRARQAAGEAPVEPPDSDASEADLLRSMAAALAMLRPDAAAPTESTFDALVAALSAQRDALAARPAPSQACLDDLRSEASVVFVVDSSHSLLNTYPNVLHFLDRALAGLKPEQKFKVIFFQGKTLDELPAPTPTQVSAESRAATLKYARERIKPRGVGNPLPALERALADRPGLVCILSDSLASFRPGEAPHEEIIARLDQLKQAGGSRISTVGFYAEEPEGTLRLIAEKHRGVYTAIRDAQATNPNAARGP